MHTKQTEVSVYHCCEYDVLLFTEKLLLYLSTLQFCYTLQERTSSAQMLAFCHLQLLIIKTRS